MARHIAVLVVAAPLFALLAATAAPAQEVRAAAAEEMPSAEQVTAARAAAEADTTLDPSVRDQVLALLDAALRAVEAERAASNRLLELEGELAALPTQREAIAADMATMVEGPVAIPPDATLDRLRAERDEADANLRAARDRQANLEREIAQRAERRTALPNEIATLDDALSDLQQAAATPPGTDAPAALTTARAWAFTARRAELVRRIAAARAELALIDAHPEIDALRRERAARRIVVREAAVGQWQTIVATASTRQAEVEASEARRIAADASPAVREIAERTVEFVERLVDPEPTKGVEAANREIAGHIARIDARLAQLARQYEQDRQRVLDTGMAGLTNVRLRRQRTDLPDLKVLSRGRTTLRRELASVQRELTDLEIERESAGSLLAQREEILAMFPPEADESNRAEFIAELDRRLAARQRAMDALIEALRIRDDRLLEIQDKLIPLTALTREYIDFIDERILWIRSMESINVADVRAAWEPTLKVFEPGALSAFGSRSIARLFAAPLLPAFVIAAAAMTAWLAIRVRRRRNVLADLVSRPHTEQTIHTVEATLIAVGWAAVWPALLGVLSWMAGTVDDPASLGPMLAGGLADAAWMLFVLRLIGETTRRNGLAIAHYGWRPESCAMLRREMRWFAPLSFALVFIQGALEFEQSRTGIDPLARLATMALSASAAVLALRLLGPRRGLLADMIARSRAPWIERLLFVLYPLSIALPVTLIALDATGFSFSVNQLHFAVFKTVLFGMALLLAGGLVTRWRLITRRRLAIEEARKRRIAATSGDDGQAATADGDSLTLESAGLNLVTIDAQTRQLMRTGFAVTLAVGLFVIWSKLLPALGMLGRVELWPHFLQVRETLVAPPTLDAVIGERALAAVRRTDHAAGGERLRVFSPAGVPLGGSSGRANGGTPTSPPAEQAEPRATSTPSAQIPTFPGLPTGQASPRAESAATSGDGGDGQGRVSIANLLTATFITILAILISKNIPGLLEILVLQRLPLSASARYAITAMTRYVIAVFAIFLAFGAIGIGWSQVQWLVAAATVGIAFGLQEIVANFISGVIILFERPIRVGDTVTVGTVSGTVTKIQMRATTITDWDRKELIIPNREFITGQVINWTLSDPTLRLVIPVGIAYGSDTDTAERLLRECADRNPRVLKDPAPMVLFTRFGESSLDYELRAFLPSIEHLVQVRHELHRAVDDAFRAAKIEIAFPQRDIHVRGIAGELGIRRGPVAAGAADGADHSDPKPT